MDVYDYFVDVYAWEASSPDMPTDLWLQLLDKVYDWWVNTPMDVADANNPDLEYIYNGNFFVNVDEYKKWNVNYESDERKIMSNINSSHGYLFLGVEYLLSENFTG